MANQKKTDRSDKLKSALRDNLRKRKAQTRKLDREGETSDVSLRERDLAPKPDKAP